MKKSILSGFGFELPMLPTVPAGSLPKPVELMELRHKVATGMVPSTELDRREKLATEIWIREQERLGLDILVDGEMGRSDMVDFFAKRIDGFETGGLVRIMGHHYIRKPIIKRKLSWTGPMSVDSWLFAARLTKRPVKAVVTGPYTMADGAFDEFYSSRAAAVGDLIPILKKEIQALTENGAKIIQIDEPALSARPEEFSVVADALRELTKGFKAYFILRHHFGDLTPVWAKLGQLPVNQFSFAGVNSDYDILPLFKKKPLNTDIALGVIDADPAHTETVPGVTERLKQIVKIIPDTQLWITSDGGLKNLPVKDASTKLRALVDAARKIRPLRKPIS